MKCAECGNWYWDWNGWFRRRGYCSKKCWKEEHGEACSDCGSMNVRTYNRKAYRGIYSWYQFCEACGHTESLGSSNSYLKPPREAIK